MKLLESVTQTLTPALGSGLYTGSPNIHRPRSSLATKKSAGKLPSKGPHSPGLAQQCCPRQEHSQHAFSVCSSLYSRTAILALPLAQEACTTHDSSLTYSRNCLSYRHRTKTQCAAALAYRPRYQHMTQHRSSIHARGTPKERRAPWKVRVFYHIAQCICHLHWAPTPPASFAYRRRTS